MKSPFLSVHTPNERTTEFNNAIPSTREPLFVDEANHPNGDLLVRDICAIHTANQPVTITAISRTTTSVEVRLKGSKASARQGAGSLQVRWSLLAPHLQCIRQVNP